MSDDLLREAAALMRSRAEAATPSDGVRWGDGKGYSPLSYARQNDAEHVWSWRPIVALAAADSLAQHADLHDSYDCVHEPCAHKAWAVLYLGGDGA